MFRRKSTAEVEGEICPYCEFVNKLGASTCSQCYYELNKAPRDQGESISAEVSNSIFNELMSDDDDSWEEGEAVDVVLTLDQDPLEVEQYEATNFESEEPEKIGFMESSAPEMHDTVNHEPVDVSAEDVGKEIKHVPKLEFTKVDPFDEVPEPVHQGKGTLFSPTTSAKMDGDLLGHVGGSELPSLPPDDLYDNKVDLTAKKAPAPTPAVVLPNLPALPEISKIDTPVDTAPAVNQSELPPSVYTSDDPTKAMDVDSPKASSEDSHESAETNRTLATEDIIIEAEHQQESATPNIETNSRIWLWAEGEPWDPRQVHREVVSALEQIKSGKVAEAAATIDSLGPHLTNENVDLIYHIGMVLKQLDRTDEVQLILTNANNVMPGNQHVASAMAHLGV